MQCFCDPQRTFSSCCEPFLTGALVPETPEALMRSRFSAFCRKDIEYLKATTHPQAQMDWKANEEWAKRADFIRLEVLRAGQDGPRGVVEFKAFYRLEGKEHCHHEISSFRQHQGRWLYRDGRIVNTD